MISLNHQIPKQSEKPTLRRTGSIKGIYMAAAVLLLALGGFWSGISKAQSGNGATRWTPAEG